jgi:hypothetical protein
VVLRTTKPNISSYSRSASLKLSELYVRVVDLNLEHYLSEEAKNTLNFHLSNRSAESLRNFKAKYPRALAKGFFSEGFEKCNSEVGTEYAGIPDGVLERDLNKLIESATTYGAAEQEDGNMASTQKGKAKKEEEVDYEALFEEFGYNAGGNYQSCVETIEFLRTVTEDRRILVLSVALAIYDSPRSWVFKGRVSSDKAGTVTEKAMHAKLLDLMPKLKPEVFEELDNPSYRSPELGWTKESRNLNMTMIKRLACMFLSYNHENNLVINWIKKHQGRPTDDSCVAAKTIEDPDKLNQAMTIFNEDMAQFRSDVIHLESFDPDFRHLLR